MNLIDYQRVYNPTRETVTGGVDIVRPLVGDSYFLEYPLLAIEPRTERWEYIPPYSVPEYRGFGIRKETT
jgi:hypothetical protein